MARRLTLLTSILLLLAAGCGSTATQYVHPNADLSALRKVAVLPFENVSGVSGASDKVHKIFLVELLSMETFDVIEPGQVSKVVRGETATTPDALTPDDLKRIGKALNADALFLGQVLDYGESRAGNGLSSPEITLQFRLVETASGATVWSSSRTRAGVKATTRLFGMRGDSVTESARKVIREQLGSLLQ